MKNQFLTAFRQGNSSPSAVVSTLFLAIGAFFMGSMPMALVLQAKGISNPDLANISQSMDPLLFFTLSMLPFVFGFGALLFSITSIHRRPFLTLIRVGQKPKWKNLFLAAAVTFLFSAGFDVYGYFTDPEAYVFTFHWQPFLIMAVLSLLLFPIQAGFEELFIRGYLLQLTGVPRGAAPVALIVTSALFAVLHASNAEVDKFGFWEMMAVYGGTGLMLGIFTLLSEGLEIALGYHIMNNIYAALVIHTEGSSLDTPSLFFRKVSDTSGIIGETVLGLLIFSTIIIIIFRLFDLKKLIR